MAHMTSSTAVRETWVSEPSTVMTTSTNFHAWTKLAAVACRKMSREMTRACERRGWMYSPIYRSALISMEVRTTSLATLSQKERTTRADGGNTAAAVSASSRNVSRTCEMKASIGVKSSCLTVAPWGVVTFLLGQMTPEGNRLTRYSPASPTWMSRKRPRAFPPTPVHIPNVRGCRCPPPTHSSWPRQRFAFPRCHLCCRPFRMRPDMSSQSGPTQLEGPGGGSPSRVGVVERVIGRGGV